MWALVAQNRRDSMDSIMARRAAMRTQGPALLVLVGMVAVSVPNRGTVAWLCKLFLAEQPLKDSGSNPTNNL